MNILVDLFVTFAKVGVMTFGGGYAMLPILQREVVDNKGWATEEELMDYFAIGQCTPGIIAVNTATFIGQKCRGTIGGIRICVCVLILNAVVKLYKKAVVDKATLAIFVVVALGSYFSALSPVVFVLLAAAMGIALQVRR